MHTRDEEKEDFSVEFNSWEFCLFKFHKRATMRPENGKWKRHGTLDESEREIKTGNKKQESQACGRFSAFASYFIVSISQQKKTACSQYTDMKETDVRMCFR